MRSRRSRHPRRWLRYNDVFDAGAFAWNESSAALLPEAPSRALESKLHLGAQCKARATETYDYKLHRYHEPSTTRRRRTRLQRCDFQNLADATLPRQARRTSNFPLRASVGGRNAFDTTVTWTRSPRFARVTQRAWNRNQLGREDTVTTPHRYEPRNAVTLQAACCTQAPNDVCIVADAVSVRYLHARTLHPAPTSSHGQRQEASQ